MHGSRRENIQPGMEVWIVLKPDQRSGKLTRGIVKDLLTRSPHHPHGIKVRLTDGQVGRVKKIAVVGESSDVLSQKKQHGTLKPDGPEIGS